MGVRTGGARATVVIRLLVSSALVAVVASCTPATAPSAPINGVRQVCAPANMALSRVELRIEGRSPSGEDQQLLVSMGSRFRDGSEATTLEFRVSDPENFAIYVPPFVPDPGLCLTVNATNGLQFSYSLVADPAALLRFLFFPGPVIDGDSPGAFSS